MHDHQLLTFRLAARVVDMKNVGMAEHRLAGRNINMHDIQTENQKMSERTLTMTDLHLTLTNLVKISLYLDHNIH